MESQQDEFTSRQRCTGPGVCPHLALKGLTLCSHHAADARRGMTPSQQRLRALGLDALSGRSPLDGGPALVLQVGKPHRERTMERMACHAYNAALIFEEQCQKSDVGLLIFRTDQDTQQLLKAALDDWPLCLALTRAPFVASCCSIAPTSATDGNGTSAPVELVKSWRTACAAATNEGRKLKLSAPLAIRQALLDAVLAAPTTAASLVTSGEDLVFHVASAFRGLAYFYHAHAAETYPPHPALREKIGHWHSSASSDKSGKSLDVCRAHYKLREAFREEASLANGLARSIKEAEEKDGARGAGVSGGGGGGGCAGGMPTAAATPAAAITCVDIGASPGGWTDLLSRSPHCRAVVAFDTGALDADVASRPNVVHLPMLLSTTDGGVSIARLRASIAPATCLDYVVCDANIPPAAAAGLVAHLARCGLLAPKAKVGEACDGGAPAAVDHDGGGMGGSGGGAKVVLTLKSPLRVRPSQAASVRQAQREEAEAALGHGFGDIRVRHLFANTQHECTLTARYVGGGGAAGVGCASV